MTFGTVTIRVVDTPAARMRRFGLVLLLLAALAIALLAGSPGAVATAEVPVRGTDTWVVAQGDTLWAIAAEVAGPGGDVREMVATIKALNAKQTASIMVGEQLLVPLAR